MNGKENPIELLVMCAVMILLSVLGIVGGFSRDLFGNMDGILILGICLMMALISVLLFLGLAREQGWIGKKSNAGGPGNTPAAAK
jgi:hypothetical protein